MRLAAGRQPWHRAWPRGEAQEGYEVAEEERAAFQAAGLDVVAAPHGFRSGGEIGLLDFIPSSSAMESSWLALHESLGMLWYRWTDRI